MACQLREYHGLCGLGVCWRLLAFRGVCYLPPLICVESLSSLAARSLAMALFRISPLALPAVTAAAQHRHRDFDATPVCLDSSSGRPAKSPPPTGLRASAFFKGSGELLLSQRPVAVCTRRMDGSALGVQSAQNFLEDAARQTVRGFSFFTVCG